MRTRVFIEDGAAGPFQVANGGVGIHTDNKDIALAPGTFEITNMSDVQSVKTAVGKDDALALALVLSEILTQHFPGDDFGSGVAHDLRSGSGCLGTNGVEKFLAGNGRRAALHDYQATGDVGDVRGLKR